MRFQVLLLASLAISASLAESGPSETGGTFVFSEQTEEGT